MNGDENAVRDIARRAVAALWQAPLGDPAYDDPAYDDPAYDDPAYDDPAYDGSAGHQPAQARPALRHPPHGGPLGASPAHDDPGRDHPETSTALSAAPAPEAVFAGWYSAVRAAGVRDLAAWAGKAAAKTADLGAFVALCDPVAPAAGPLAGMPVAVKDVLDVAGQPTRNGTSGFGGRAATRDSVAWARLRAAGAVLIGRTTLPELAWDVRTPGCRNPWATGHDPGGSSGGSAVAVAAGVVPAALGSDTGGSIRIPAALCGVAGLRPTAGAVSRHGATALAPTMDTVGPIATTAAGCLLIHEILTGAGGAHRPRGGMPRGGMPRGGMPRVGWPAGLWQGRVSPDVAGATEAAAGALRRAGVAVEPVELPLAARYARPAAYVIILAESAALWGPRLDGEPGALSARTAALLRAGADVGVAGYVRALRVAAAIRREVTAAMARHRLTGLLLPTVPVAAAPAGAESAGLGGRQVPVESAYVALTGLASVTGLPALSVPCGLDGAGLPLGAQLVGTAGGEPGLCALGTLIEESPGGRAVADARARLAARLAG
jgi:aspartyl-tRNA(Asn)/glutamyl-tRNA(Gln) amidotransferase subunit A